MVPKSRRTLSNTCLRASTEGRFSSAGEKCSCAIFSHSSELPVFNALINASIWLLISGGGPPVTTSWPEESSAKIRLEVRGRAYRQIDLVIESPFPIGEYEPLIKKL